MIFSLTLSAIIHAAKSHIAKDKLLAVFSAEKVSGTLNAALSELASTKRQQCLNFQHG